MPQHYTYIRRLPPPAGMVSSTRKDTVKNAMNCRIYLRYFQYTQNTIQGEDHTKHVTRKNPLCKGPD